MFPNKRDAELLGEEMLEEQGEREIDTKGLFGSLDMIRLLGFAQKKTRTEIDFSYY